MPDENKNNYGIAITGTTGSKETLPVHLLTNPNGEPNEIKDGKNTRPTPTPITLTACITGLTKGKTYKIYIYNYNKLSYVADSNFNAHAKQAAECISFTATGSSYVMTKGIMSSDQIAFRVVPEDGP